MFTAFWTLSGFYGSLLCGIGSTQYSSCCAPRLSTSNSNSAFIISIHFLTGQRGLFPYLTIFIWMLTWISPPIHLHPLGMKKKCLRTRWHVTQYQMSSFNTHWKQFYIFNLVHCQHNEIAINYINHAVIYKIWKVNCSTNILFLFKQVL